MELDFGLDLGVVSLVWSPLFLTLGVVASLCLYLALSSLVLLTRVAYAATCGQPWSKNLSGRAEEYGTACART